MLNEHIFIIFLKLHPPSHRQKKFFFLKKFFFFGRGYPTPSSTTPMRYDRQCLVHSQQLNSVVNAYSELRGNFLPNVEASGPSFILKCGSKRYIFFEHTTHKIQLQCGIIDHAWNTPRASITLYLSIRYFVVTFYGM